MNPSYFRNLGTRRALIAGAAGIVVLIAVALAWQWVTAPVVTPDQRKPGEIVARGRIEPQGRVITINSPADTTVTVIRELKVDQGSIVEAGQVLAVLDGYNVQSANLAVAQSSLQLAELRRIQVQAGAGRRSDIAAQTNVIAAKRSALVRLQKDFERTSALYQNKDASAQALDSISAQLDQGKQELEQAQNALKSLSEVRGVDDAVAVAQIEVEKNNVALAKASLERLTIRAPTAGTILSIQTRAGEAVQADGILRMGDLKHLIVVAEVDQSLVNGVTDKMKAQLIGDMLPQQVSGSVSRIANEVYRQKRPTSDILIGRDARIVEVEVTPDTPLPPVVGGEVVVHLLPADSH